MSKERLTQLGYTDILAGNAALAGKPAGKLFKVRVLANVTVAPLKEILEYELRRCGINAVVELGDYNSITRNSLEASDANAVILFWETANLIESFSSRAMVLENAVLEEIEHKTITELDFVLNNLRKVPLVLLNTFSSLLFSSREIDENAFDHCAASLTSYARGLIHPNLVLIDIDKCIASTSVEKAVDWRMWLSSKLLYSTQFFQSYVQLIAPVFKSLGGKAKKALIFDCDNTLWKGIIGEDGFDGIGISSSTKEGQPYFEVQTMALALHKRGVILGLCSKNNPGDVEELLERHPGMVLRNEHFVVKRVNWNDKVKNLQEIAETLNIGLDSIVFVDDSEFEASLVEQCIPQVEVLRVPRSPSEYPQYFRDHMDLFWIANRTDEDANRTAMYKHQAVREEERAKFVSLDDYLRSLQLVLTISCDSRENIRRVAQLTQKTNQFNLTTKRYAEADIAEFVASPQWLVFAFSLADRFGDFGLTGVALIALDATGSSAEWDTLLLSCRALGRYAEIKFVDYVIEELRGRGIKTLKATYLRTTKNGQVESFFESRGFQMLKQDEEGKTYRMDLCDYNPAAIDYIQLREGG